MLIRSRRVKSRLANDMHIYSRYNYQFIEETGLIIKPITSIYELRVKINIRDNVNHIAIIGSFIRTVVRLINIEPNKMVFVIDLTSYDLTQIKITNLIQDIITTSTTAAAFVNIIINNDNILNGLIEFKVRTENGKIGYNIIEGFRPDYMYLSFDFEDRKFACIYAPVIHQLQSLINGYTIIPFKKPASYELVICIEKTLNIDRLYYICHLYNALDNVTICSNNPTPNKYNIPCLDVTECARMLIDRKKSVVAVDLHENALELVYGKNMDEIDNSIFVFGFESIGIPDEILSICNTFVQFQSSLSINLVASVSIMLSLLN
jgi:hypothetical protein